MRGSPTCISTREIAATSNTNLYAIALRLGLDSPIFVSGDYVGHSRNSLFKRRMPNQSVAVYLSLLMLHSQKMHVTPR